MRGEVHLREVGAQMFAGGVIIIAYYYFQMG
jgi:hypothetical protein